MQSQNVNLIKPNKSSTPPQINISQLPTLCPLPPPNFHPQAAQPLNFTYEQVRSISTKPSQNTMIPHSSSKPIPPPKINTLPLTQQLQTLRKQNLSLKQNLTQIQQLYQQQKFKYNELKNLYKQGQAMFELLEDKKITLQKQNKELKQLLENFYHELQQENQLFQDDENKRNKRINLMSMQVQGVQNGNKVQKVKIGNKKVPVIKVNVPPQTFTKKEHTTSIFSQNPETNLFDVNSKQQLSLLRQQITQLKSTINQLQKKLIEMSQQLETKKKLIFEYERKEMNAKTLSAIDKVNLQTFEMKQSSPIGTQNQHHKSVSSVFEVNFAQVQNQFLPQSINQPQMLQYHDKQNLTYYKSKYNILETQVKKKDQALKNLYNQCYSLQAEINRLKTQSSSVQQTQAESHRDPRHIWTQQKHFSHFQMSNQSRQPLEQHPNESFLQGEGSYQSKITQLETRINDLNQLCISNVNQTFRINELNDTITKLTRENSQNEQKINSQEMELSRLYKILENKNIELSEIYTTITESKRNYALDESKKKSINNVFVNTPQKHHQFLSQNIFYSKGFSKDQSFI